MRRLTGICALSALLLSVCFAESAGPKLWEVKTTPQLLSAVEKVAKDGGTIRLVYCT